MKAYLCYGELSFVYASVDKLACTDLDLDFYPELRSGDPMIRFKRAREWLAPVIKWTPSDNKRKRPKFTDAIGVQGIVGVETIVSETAAQIMAPEVGSECLFLPVNFLDAPQPYYAFYVVRILDCLDKSRTRFGRPFGDIPTPISIPRLKEDLVDGFVFRLPGGVGYQLNYDLATERFLSLVTSRNITGFRFRENAGAIPFGT